MHCEFAVNETDEIRNRYNGNLTFMKEKQLNIGNTSHSYDVIKSMYSTQLLLRKLMRNIIIKLFKVGIYNSY